MAKTSKPKAKRTLKVHHAMVTPEEQRRSLRARIRVQKEILRLASQLEREIRRSDYRLLELGGALMGRAVVVHREEAAADLARDASIAERAGATEG